MLILSSSWKVYDVPVKKPELQRCRRRSLNYIIYLFNSFFFFSTWCVIFFNKTSQKRVYGDGLKQSNGWGCFSECLKQCKSLSHWGRRGFLTSWALKGGATFTWQSLVCFLGRERAIATAKKVKNELKYWMQLMHYNQQMYCYTPSRKKKKN